VWVWVRVCVRAVRVERGCVVCGVGARLGCAGGCVRRPRGPLCVRRFPKPDSYLTLPKISSLPKIKLYYYFFLKNPEQTPSECCITYGSDRGHMTGSDSPLPISFSYCPSCEASLEKRKKRFTRNGKKVTNPGLRAIRSKVGDFAAAPSQKKRGYDFELGERGCC